MNVMGTNNKQPTAVKLEINGLKFRIHAHLLGGFWSA